MTATRKKLIEVAIPIDEINRASIREKTIRQGHPSTFHLWWARRPLATCRAVLFAQLVDDPSSFPDKFSTPDAIQKERKRLFSIMKELVQWKNSNNEEILEEARKEIKMSCNGDTPTIYDPFSGGASIPLEANRLELDVVGSDINPIAVLIGRSLLDFPRQYVDKAPSHNDTKLRTHYNKLDGLSEDIRYFAQKLRELAFKKIGHLYPDVSISLGRKTSSAKVVAWIWVRTVRSPDPGLNGVHVPLIGSYWLCKKTRKKVWIESEIDKTEVQFKICKGVPEFEEIIDHGTKFKNSANFTCLLTGTSIPSDYIKSEGRDGRLGWKLISIVANSKNGRQYLPASEWHEKTAFGASPRWRPEFPMSQHSQYMSVTNYGITKWSDFFLDRQTIAIETFLDLIPEAVGDLKQNPQYKALIATYLSLGVSRMATRQCVGSYWDRSRENVAQVFTMQALPMRWDTAESNPFSESTGNFIGQIDYIVRAIEKLPLGNRNVSIKHKDATSVNFDNCVISTDPPYYDNIPYADLSDFFYVWLRRRLKNLYPDLFSTLLVPKADELVADRERHKGKEKAEKFFLEGMTSVMKNMANKGSQDFPTTIYYAYRQGTQPKGDDTSRGWTTFLQAIVDAGYQVNATWPLRTEYTSGIKQKRNVLSTSIVVVCRPRPSNAPTATRSEFVNEIRSAVGNGLKQLREANLSPADIPQSSIGFGISVYTKYRYVIEANDTFMSVHTALQLINKELDEVLNGLQGNFDNLTRFLISWFEQYGLEKGAYGTADSIAKARVSSVDNARIEGLVESSGGFVRILHRSELPETVFENSNFQNSVWASSQAVIHILERFGETKAAKFLSTLPVSHIESIKDLSYCLYDISVNKVNNAKEANSYNGLISVWSDLVQQAVPLVQDENEFQNSLDLESNSNA